MLAAMRHPVGRRGLACAVAAALAVLVPAGSAEACSIAQSDPRTRVAGAEAAVYVEVVAKTPLGEDGPGRRYAYRLRVIRAYKGGLSGTFDAEARSDGAACGVELDAGDRLGLLLSGRRRPWELGLGSLISRRDLIRGTAPFPRPNGSGPVALLVGGTYGKATLLALDRRGRTLAYGFLPPGGPMAVCPGSARFVRAERGGLRVYRTRDLRPVGRRAAPREEIDSLRCLDPAGSAIAGFVRGDVDQSGRSRLFVSGAGGFRTLSRGRATDADLAAGRAVVVDRRRILSVGYADGMVRELACAPRLTTSLAVSPDGRHAAGQFSPGDQARTRLFVIDLATGRLHSAALRSPNLFGAVHWLDATRFTYVNGGGDAESNLTFDARLRRLARAPGWGSRGEAVLGPALFSIDFGGRLWQAAPPSAAGRLVRRLPDELAGPIVAVPGGPVLRGASRRVPAP